jgi:hypothetical protein
MLKHRFEKIIKFTYKKLREENEKLWELY